MKRQRIPEVMDGPSVDERAHAHALRSLNRIARLLGFDRQQYRCLKNLLGNHASVLDIGCGGGGYLGHIARQQGPESACKLIGLDYSTFALNCARQWQGERIRVLASDARRLPFANDSIDVVTCALFLHHFDEADAVIILREAARVARRGIVFADLSRSWPAWALTWLVTRVVSRSWIFHVDGPRSVRAAYDPGELTDLARLAGLEGARVERRFPFRLMLTWKKASASVAKS